MTRRTETRSKILALAQTLLQRHGFHGFSYRHLADALGIKTAAVHYHFKSKETLGVEIVAAARLKFQQWAAEVDSNLENPKARLDAFFDMHREFLDSKIMPTFGALEAEYGTLPKRMRDEVRNLASEIHGWIARTLRQGQNGGDLVFSGDPDAQALMVGAAVQGALLIAQTFGAERYWATIEQIKLQMKPEN